MNENNIKAIVFFIILVTFVYFNFDSVKVRLGAVIADNKALAAKNRSLVKQNKELKSLLETKLNIIIEQTKHDVDTKNAMELQKLD